MKQHRTRSLILAGTACAALFASGAMAQNFNIPGGDLRPALDAYMKQTGVPLVYPSSAVTGVRTTGVRGPLSADDALGRILSGTGFSMRRDSSGMIAVVPEQSSALEAPLLLAQASPRNAPVETVTVTSSKLGGQDVQTVPIAITALSQEQLTATQQPAAPIW